MKGLFQIDDSLANKINYYHLIFLMASLPFDRFYSHLILISYGLHTLIHLKQEDLLPLLKWRMLILQSVFFVTVFSTAYSMNKNEGFNEWGKQVPILILPVLLCINPLNLSKYRSNLLYAFSLVCTFTVIYLYADALITIRHYHLAVSTLFSGAFINHNFSEPIEMHATFLSMQLAIAFIYLLISFFKETGKYRRFIYAVCGLVLIAGLIQLSSKSVLAGLFLTINLAVTYFLFRGLKRLKFITISWIISFVVAAGILYPQAFRERIFNELKTDLSKGSVNETEDGRLTRWNVVINLIKKKPVTGYGAGSEMELLQEAFFKNKLYNSYLFRLNAHSEYLSMLLKSGMGGFFIYLATLIWGTYQAFHRKDLLFFSFMLTVAIVSFSENLLDVDKGIFYYAYFFSFFLLAKPFFGSKRQLSTKPNFTPQIQNAIDHSPVAAN